MTSRLIASAVDSWEVVDGYAAAHGMEELADMSVGRLSNFMYFLLTRNLDDETKVAQFRARLWQPPASELRSAAVLDPRSPWSAQNETAGLKGMIKALGGGNAAKQGQEVGADGTAASANVPQGRSDGPSTPRLPPPPAPPGARGRRERTRSIEERQNSGPSRLPHGARSSRS